MTFLLLIVYFFAGMVATIALELAGLQYLLEPLRQPIEVIMGLGSQ